jgi:hypothetical protein
MTGEPMNTPSGVKFSLHRTEASLLPAHVIPVRTRRQPAATIFPFLSRIVWLIPLVLVFPALLMDGEGTIVLWSALAAAIACIIALAVVGYNLTSFVSITAIYHLIIYPLAALGNLLLPEPLVRWDLWIDTYLAMQGCAVGILGLALGAWLANLSLGPQKVHAYGRTLKAPTSPRINLLIALLIVPVALILGQLGMYYHMAILENSMEAQSWLNLVAIVQYIAYSGIFLQVYRYTRTNSTKDAFWACGLLLMCILIFLPSGSRWSAYGFLPLLLLVFAEWEPSTRKKIVVISGCVVVMLALTSGISAYRNIRGLANVDLEGKYEFALRSTLNPGASPEDMFGTIISRLSDYVAAGRIIAFTPEPFDFRGAESIENFWQVYVPGFLNIVPDRINLADGIELCDRYGITMAYKGGGSSPCMIVGDLFSRWGWPGIFLGMLVIGFVLRQFDLRIFYRWDTFTIIYFVLMARLILTIPAGSLIQFCVTILRDSLVMALIAYVLAQVIETKNPRYVGLHNE